ncbi:unnamed protein product [Allacma fusca]|uniref:Uncharacterized protein n=1 Tax=Allacma fusca TaxID=39272 RepID=A0A8J2LES6_9HEXA|nr:unnamed protein product [Allacma fusca]
MRLQLNQHFAQAAFAAAAAGNAVPNAVIQRGEEVPVGNEIPAEGPSFDLGIEEQMLLAESWSSATPPSLATPPSSATPPTSATTPT